jgi:hypothetical protein
MNKDEIIMGRGYRPSLIVALAALAIVVGIALKSYTREQRIANIAPVSSASAENVEPVVEN